MDSCLPAMREVLVLSWGYFRFSKQRIKNGLEDIETETAVQEAANTRVKEIAISFSHTRPGDTGFSAAIPGWI